MRFSSVRDWIDGSTAKLVAMNDGADEDFLHPTGEQSLVGPDSVSWQVFKNPVTLLIGGTAAVVLELAEPRVRTGVYEHSSFRVDPMSRLRRTGRATMVTVYGARSHAQAAIARIRARHSVLSGVTPDGQAYRADDPELLTWVHATASHCFLSARDRYVMPSSHAQHDRFYKEGRLSAELYGATKAPASRHEMNCLLEDTRSRLEGSPLIGEFLRMMSRLPLLPPPLRPMQELLVRAAVDLLPSELQQHLSLDTEWRLKGWQLKLVGALAGYLDKVPLMHSAPVLACRRVGLPADYLWSAAAGRAGSA